VEAMGSLLRHYRWVVARLNSQVANSVHTRYLPA
jgi:hypothetical protein